MHIFDYNTWAPKLPELTARYAKAEPFPSIQLDNFLVSDAARAALAAFPSPASKDWVHYKHFNEKKLAQTKRALIPEDAGRVIDELNTPRFVNFLSKLTGIEGLMPDPGLEGGGLHQIVRGGFLNIHADFTAHPHQRYWARRVNALIYLNENWTDAYGGHLQLWDRQAKHCVKKILPVFNRCVIFSTDPDSYHGHPEPLTCPEGWTRKSIALYYFTKSETKPYTRSTEYKSRLEDGVLKKCLVYADKMALRAFDFAKRRLGLTDKVADVILRRLSK